MTANVLQGETATMLNDRLRRIEYLIAWDKRIHDLKQQIRGEYAVEVASINAALTELRNKRPAKKPRWPDNVPAPVLKSCQDFWKGTTELQSFRIHGWNDAVILTSYPAAPFWTNGGRQKGEASYRAISRTEHQYGKPKELSYNQGPTSPSKMQEMLNPKPQ